MNEYPSKSFSFLASVSPGRRYDTYWLAEAIQIVPSSLCDIDIGRKTLYDEIGVMLPSAIDLFVTFPTSIVHRKPSLSMKEPYTVSDSSGLLALCTCLIFSMVFDVMSYLNIP